MSFVFVNFSNPDETEHGSFKKQVRSAAAAYSHRAAPRKGLKAARYRQRREGKTTTAATQSSRKRSTQEESGDAPTSNESASTRRSSLVGEMADQRLSAPPQAGSSGSARRIKGESISDQGSSSRSPLPYRLSPSPGAVQRFRSPIRGQHVASKTAAPPIANIGRKRSRGRSVLRDGGSSQALVSANLLPDPCYLDASQRDPFDTYPVAFEPWFGWLLDFWYKYTLPRSQRLIKVRQQDIQVYVVWSRSFELTEPALFYTSLFLATGIPVANGQMDIEKALWLRGHAIRALNEALDDPKRATSNAVISAVGKIALHEFIYGDRKASIRIHRPAQQYMIAMRGGIERLGLPPITLQLMTWYDALMAAESGTVAYFKDVPRKMALVSYTREEAVRVTDVSSPHRSRHPGYGTVETP